MKQLALLLLVMRCPCAWGATAPDVAAYAIPDDAVKKGPGPSRDPNLKRYLYFAPGVETKWENKLGIEKFYKGTLIERELFKDGKKHGVQREWRKNGQPKSEAPYHLGVMEGTFKHWNDKAQLVGQYEITQGQGVANIYSDQGVLDREINYQNSNKNGWLMELSSNYYKERALVWLKDSDIVGTAYGFYGNGQVEHLSFGSGVLRGDKLT